jgi:CDP-glycerol glycerophosphotransferase (TagB/SpsB family)/GT2 family glycosyltransferase
MKNISIVLLNYNSYSQTIDCTYSYLQQKNIFLSIIIIDNCSTDNSFKKITNEFSQAKNISIFKSSYNGGYSYGNNLGIKIAEKQNPDYIVISNPDIFIFDRNMLFKLSNIYSELDSPGFIAPSMKINGHISSMSAWRTPTFKDDILDNSRFFKFFLRKKISYQFLDDISPQQVSCLPGSFVFTTIEVMKKIGYFDESTFLYCEERIAASKLMNLGFSNFLIPQLFYSHMVSQSISSVMNLSKQRFHLVNSRMYFHNKYNKIPKLITKSLKVLNFLFEFESIIIFLVKRFYKLLEKIFKWLPFIILYFPFKLFSANFLRKPQYLLFGTGTGLFHDNSKYLFEYYIKKTTKYKLFWVTDNKNTYNELKFKNYPVIMKNSLKSSYYAANAKFYFITSELFDCFYFINSETKLVQLWHGIPIKKINYDSKVDKIRLSKREKYFSSNYLYNRIDYFVCEDESQIKLLSIAFKIDDKKFLPFGQPRNSFNIQTNEVKNLREKYYLDQYSKIILYAPTFRDIGTSSHSIDIINNHIVADYLSANNYLLLMKAHPFLANMKINFISKDMMDISKEPDIQILMLISDVLVSDYSSLMFDFHKLNKPIYRFNYDEYNYKNIRGGFYETSIDLEKKSQVINCISEIDISEKKDLNVSFDNESIFKKIEGELNIGS